MDIDTPALLNLVEALGIGLLIGAERERRKDDAGSRAAAGIRTFALASMVGAVSVLAGGERLLVAALVGTFALAGLAYWRSRPDEVGLTSEIALVMAVLLGGLSIRKPEIAAGIAVVVTILLAARAPLHRFVRSVVTDDELRDALLLAAATLVVLPVLPDRPMGPYATLNPNAIWIVVILVMAIGAAGHVATRCLGPRYGLPLSGLASGFVSSAATVRDMGERAAKAPGLLAMAAAGASLSSVSTIIQLTLVLAVTSKATLHALMLPLAAIALVSALYGLALTLLALRRHSETEPDGARQSAFSLSSAVLFALTLALVLLVSAALQDWLGNAGLIMASGLAGFVNTQSATIAVALLVATGKLAAADAVLPILTAITANVIFRIALAARSGTREYAQRVIPGLILAALAAWIGVWLTRVLTQ